MNNFDLGPGIVLMGLFIAAGYTIYTFIKATHLERMAKIQHGMDTDIFARKNGYFALKLGMLMIGIAFGLLLAFLFEKTLDLDEIVFYPSFMLLFGGIGLVGSFFWARELEKNK